MTTRWILTLFAWVICNNMVSAQSSTDRKIKTIDGWEVSNEPYDHGLINEMAGKISDKIYKQINGVVVIKNGQLLIEEYFGRGRRGKIHNPRSVGKTFASTMLGMALEEGYLKNIKQTLSDFYDLSKYKNSDSKKSSVTLRQLMTMTSGFEAFDFDPESIGNEENMYPTDNWVNWALNLPMASDRNPGDKWYYFTGGAVLLGDIIHKSVPGGLEKYADEKLFRPLGISKYQWQYTPQKVANTAGGLSLTALGFAKYGQLYKDGGKWNGEQILPQRWVEESLQNYHQTTEQGLGYGYFWWQKEYDVNGEKHEVYFCSGNGGNKIFVFKDQPLVIVITASAYGKPYGHRQVDEMMQKYILPAVLD